jgi:hypothetical protein
VEAVVRNNGLRSLGRISGNPFRKKAVNVIVAFVLKVFDGFLSENWQF